MHALSLGDHKRASEWVDVQSHSDRTKNVPDHLPKDLGHGVAVKMTGPEKKMAPIRRNTGGNPVPPRLVLRTSNMKG